MCVCECDTLSISFDTHHLLSFSQPGAAHKKTNLPPPLPHRPPLRHGRGVPTPLSPHSLAARQVCGCALVSLCLCFARSTTLSPPTPSPSPSPLPSPSSLPISPSLSLSLSLSHHLPLYISLSLSFPHLPAPSQRDVYVVNDPNREI